MPVQKNVWKLMDGTSYIYIYIYIYIMWFDIFANKMIYTHMLYHR